MFKLLKSFLVIALFAIAHQGFAQWTASFYINSFDSKVAVGYQFNEKFWTDFRIYSNTDFDNFIPELTVNYNFVRKDIHDLYVGVGGILADGIGILVPIGLNVRPFKSDNLSLMIEFAPYLVDEPFNS